MSTSIHRPSATAPRDLLKFEPTMSFEEYLGQRTAATVTPEADEAITAQTLAIILAPVLRYDGDRRVWLIWNGTVWEEKADAGRIAVSRLLHRRVNARGGVAEPPVQPWRFATGKRRDALLADALVAGVAEQRDEGVIEVSTGAPFLPTEPAPNLGSAALLRALASLVEITPGVAARATQFDSVERADWLATPGAYLRLGADGVTVHEPDPSLYLTRAARVQYDPNAVVEGSRWEQFLTECLPDPEVRHYLHKALGMSLNGSVNERLMFCMVGGGNNGKSVLLTVLANLLGDLLYDVPETVVQPGRGDSHPTELMGFKGARIAAVSETKRDAGWSVAVLKKLRGGDTITARAMGQDFVSFRPTHTMWLFTNERPVVGPGEDAFWRTYREIDWPVTFVTEPSQPLREGERRGDPELPGYLMEHEGSIIVRWLVEGWEMYKREGLGAPAAVTAASDEARELASPFSVFARDTFVHAEGERVPASAAFALWQSWRDANAPAKAMLKPNVSRDIKVLASEMGTRYVPNNGGSAPAYIDGLALSVAGRELAAELANRSPYMRGPKLSAAASDWLREHSGLHAVPQPGAGMNPEPEIIAVTAPVGGGFAVASVTPIKPPAPFAAG